MRANLAKATSRSRASLLMPDEAASVLIDPDGAATREATLRQRAAELQAPRQPQTPYTADTVVNLETMTSPTVDGISHLMARDSPGHRRRRASAAPSETRSNTFMAELTEPGPHAVPIDPHMIQQIHADTVRASQLSLQSPFPSSAVTIQKPRQRANTVTGGRDPNNNYRSSAATQTDLTMARTSSMDSLASTQSARINRVVDYVDGINSASMAPAHFRIHFGPNWKFWKQNPRWKGYTLYETTYPPGSPGHWVANHVPKYALYGFMALGSVPLFGVLTQYFECGKDWRFDGSLRSAACPFVTSETNQQWLTDKKNASMGWTLKDPEYEQSQLILRLVNMTKEAAIDRNKLVDARHRLAHDQKVISDTLNNLWAAFAMDPATGTPYLIDGNPLFNDLQIIAPVDMDKVCKEVKAPTRICWGELDLLVKCTARSEAIIHYVNTHYGDWRWFQAELLHALLMHVLAVAPQTRFMDGFNTRRFNRLIANCRLPIQFPKVYPPGEMPELYNTLFPNDYPLPMDVINKDDTKKIVRVQTPARIKREVKNYPIMPYEFSHPSTLENLNKGKYAFLTKEENKELAEILLELGDKTDLLYAIIIGVSVIVAVILIAALVLRLTVMSRTQRLNEREHQLNMRQLAINRRDFGPLEFIQEVSDEDDSKDGSQERFQCFVETAL